MKKGQKISQKSNCLLSGVELDVTSYPRRETGRAELPERALLVTKRTHDNTASDIWVTYFFASVKKKKKKNRKCRNTF